MTSITKPPVRHPSLPKNALGFTRRDYEGAMSTLCAGCGHDSVTAALIQAVWELDLQPHRVAKMSGIGCSSKTTAYFLKQSHGFNGVHGRMPALATGANAANRGLVYIGISGDGDSLSIGLGQLCHAIRRNVNMAYVLENNGVYGLTKGQFSASADVGSKSKRGEANVQPPIDPVLLGLSLGATFVARSFSGDKAQLVPILKAAVRHNGFALIDIISPCVSFNDHDTSTKSYRYTRDHYNDVSPVDFVPLRREITAETTRHRSRERDDARRQRRTLSTRRVGLRSARSRRRVRLRAQASGARRSRHRPVAHRRERGRHARRQRDYKSAARRSAVRGTLSRKRGARRS